jgi:hypothetical protein
LNAETLINFCLSRLLLRKAANASTLHTTVINASPASTSASSAVSSSCKMSSPAVWSLLLLSFLQGSSGNHKRDSSHQTTLQHDNLSNWLVLKHFCGRYKAVP